MSQVLFHPLCLRSVEVDLELNAAAELNIARFSRVHQQHPRRSTQNAPNIVDKRRTTNPIRAKLALEMKWLIIIWNTYATNLRGLRITTNLNMSLSGSILAQAKRSSPPFGDIITAERPITENFPANRKEREIVQIRIRTAHWSCGIDRNQTAYTEADFGRWKCNFQHRCRRFRDVRKYLPPCNDKERAADTPAGTARSAMLNRPTNWYTLQNNAKNVNFSQLTFLGSVNWTKAGFQTKPAATQRWAGEATAASTPTGLT